MWGREGDVELRPQTGRFSSSLVVGSCDTVGCVAEVSCGAEKRICHGWTGPTKSMC